MALYAIAVQDIQEMEHPVKVSNGSLLLVV